MSNLIVHNWSGGIDSTSVLFQLLKQGEKLVLHSLDLLSPGNVRWRAEKRARERILKWITSRFGVTPEIIDGGQTEESHAAYAWDIEQVGYATGRLLRERSSLHRITISASMDDRQQAGSFGEHHARDMSRRTLIQNGDPERTLEWIMPNWQKSRRQVIAEMPEELLTLCHFCRRPSAAYEPCGICHTCLATKSYLPPALRKTPNIQ